MITLDQFEVQFNKLQAAFGTVKSAKIFEELYKEFEYEDYSVFLGAMKSCQYGDRFPTWDVFKQHLRNSRGVTVAEEFNGCGDCHTGVVLFRDINSNGQVSDQAANCAECSINKKKGMANVYPRRLHRDAVGVLRTQRALRQDVENGERIEEPKAKTEERVEVGQIVKEVYGSEDPDNERKRYGSLKREEEREANEKIY